mmetsp:Transcript_13489/g.31728  ORF Transcript_13489/g.31728 Transcript_13489/m.31728 type:complete len:344 (+) Transcript_13489:149-1180(+)
MLQNSPAASLVASDLLLQQLLQLSLEQGRRQTQTPIDIVQALVAASTVHPSNPIMARSFDAATAEAGIALPASLSAPPGLMSQAQRRSAPLGAAKAGVAASPNSALAAPNTSAAEVLQQLVLRQQSLALLQSQLAATQELRAVTSDRKQKQPQQPPTRRNSTRSGSTGTTASSNNSAAAAAASAAAPTAKKGRLNAADILANGITTLMMHQIAPGVSQRKLLAELDADGFAGAYNYVYLPTVKVEQEPSSRKAGQAGQQASGYAFINMVSPEMAASLVSKWAGKKLAASGSDDVQSSSKGAFFSTAAVQGLEANLLRTKKTSGFRNRRSTHMPFVASGVQLSL